MTNTINSENYRSVGHSPSEYEYLKAAFPSNKYILSSVLNLARNVLRKKTSHPCKLIILGSIPDIILLLQEFADITLVAINPPNNDDRDTYKLFRKIYKHEMQKKHNSITIVDEDALAYLKGCDASSVHLVISNFKLHGFDKGLRAKIIMEFGRILHPQGKFINADKIAQEYYPLHVHALMTQIVKFTNAYRNPAEAEYALKLIEHYIHDDHPDLIQTESEVHINLTNAGLKEIEYFKRWGMDLLLTAGHY